MVIDLTKKLYGLDGEPFVIDGEPKTVLEWVKGALNSPMNGKSFSTEESAQKVAIFIDLKKCQDLSKFELDSKAICLIKDTWIPYAPAESLAQLSLIMEGKENIFEPKK